MSFKGKKNFEKPFSVIRQVGMSLEDQLVGGFAGAIRAGVYADGETLPGIRKLADIFGVSLITVQNAVKRLCNDDYLAAGILSALDRNGIRMPHDVRFATLANKGLGPVHAQDLTRVEYDPAQSGLRIGEAVSTYLETGKATPCSIAIAFKRGETV